MKKETKTLRLLTIAAFLAISPVGILAQIAGYDQTGEKVEGQKYTFGSGEAGVPQAEYVFPVKKGNLWGFADSKGKEKIKPKYEEIGKIQTYQSTSSLNKSLTLKRAVIPVRLNGKWGFVAQNGKEIIKPVYDNVGVFFTRKIKDGWNEGNLQGAVMVTSGNEIITLNEKGKQTDDPVYVNPRTVGDVTFAFRKNSSTPVILSGPRDASISDSEAMYTISGGAHTYYVLKTDGTCLTSLTGNAVSTPEGKIGILGHDGNWILNPEFDDMDQSSTDSYILSRNGSYGLYTLSGEMILPHEYRSIARMNSDLHRIEKEPNQYALYSLGNRKVMLDNLESISYKEEAGVLTVKSNGKWGVMTQNGIMTAPCEYDNIYDSEFYNYLKVEKNGRFGLMNTSGVLKLPCIYTDFKRRPSDTFFYVYNSDGIGIARMGGNEVREIVAPGKFDSFYREYDTNFIVGEIGNKKAAICKDSGKIIGPVTAESYLLHGSKIYFGSDALGSQWYCYDKNGILIGKAVINSKAQMNKFLQMTLNK